MADTLTPVQRSKCMAAIRAKDTTPERVVRSIVRRFGFRFRLHASDLPGKPDLVFRPRQSVVFVHGCYWHMHTCVRGASAPKTNAVFWRKKREKNRVRDRHVLSTLRKSGWRVLVVWECETKNLNHLARKLDRFLRDFKIHGK
jgi:DNA mismatch endonuclease (patch repair protein)